MAKTGFAALPTQLTTRIKNHGLSFNALVLGPTGIGKTTLINSLFDIDFTDSADYERSINNVELCIKESRPRNKTIDTRSTFIEVKGFNNQLDRTDIFKPVLKFIETKYDETLGWDLDAQVGKYNFINDIRVHCCIYMISPLKFGLEAIDIVTMKQLHQRVCLIPVIGKADVLTRKERLNLVERIKQQLESKGIETFSPNNKVQFPLAIAASKEISYQGGKYHRTRTYPWGTMNIQEHSDFQKLQELVLGNILTLIEKTNKVHYESYRKEANSTNKEEREFEELQREHDKRMASLAASRMKPPVPKKILGRSFS